MKLGGHEIFVRDIGVAEKGTIVLVHSSGMSGSQWRRHSVLLREAGYRVLVPDLIGCGRSAPWGGEGAFDLRNDVEVIAALAKAEGPLTLVGHSYGGALALMAACDDGESIEAVAVYDPVLWGPHREVHGEGYLEKMKERGLDPAARGTERWMSTFVEYWSGPGGWERLGDVAREQMMKAAGQTSDQVLSISRDVAGAETYAAFEGPALVLSGTTTPTEMRESAQRVAAAMPRAEHRILEGGHMVPITHAQLFVATLFRWLGRLP